MYFVVTILESDIYHILSFILFIALVNLRDVLYNFVITFMKLVELKVG